MTSKRLHDRAELTNNNITTTTSRDWSLVCCTSSALRLIWEGVFLLSNRWYDWFRGSLFLDRLISVAIPRIRDFRGLNAKSFDGQGNYSFGLREQIVFPEIEYDKVDAMRGMDITITTSAITDEEGEALLRAFGFPIKVKAAAEEVDAAAWAGHTLK